MERQRACAPGTAHMSAVTIEVVIFDIRDTGRQEEEEEREGKRRLKGYECTLLVAVTCTVTLEKLAKRKKDAQPGEWARLDLLRTADGEFAYTKKSVFTSWSSQVNSGVGCAVYHGFRSGQFVEWRQHKHFIGPRS